MAHISSVRVAKLVIAMSDGSRYEVDNIGSFEVDEEVSWNGTRSTIIRAVGGAFVRLDRGGNIIERGPALARVKRLITPEE